MKIRCVENSIRLRVKKSEVERLKNDGRIAVSVAFPNGQTLTYGLRISEAVQAVVPMFYENHIEVQLPKELAEGWMNSNDVGIERNIELPGGAHLHVLIEKDFPCLDRPNEDKSDTFFELVPDEPDNC